MQRPDLQPADFEGFFKQVLLFAESGVNQGLVLELLAHIEKQIKRWLENPEENPTYASLVMKTIMNSSVFQEPKLAPISAQICYLKGIIREAGYRDIRKHLSQAKLDFISSTDFGGIEAWEKLGDLLYKEAMQNPPPISGSEIFADAISAYTKGNAAAKAKYIENGLMTVYNEAINSGNFEEAIKTLHKIKSFVNQPENKDIPIHPNIKKMQDQLPQVEELSKLIADAKLVEERYRLIRNNRNLSPEDVESLLGDINKDLHFLNNPVLDYYTSKILTLIGRLKKIRGDEVGEIEAYNQKAESLLNVILIDNNYSELAQPLLNYVKGKGRSEQLQPFLKLPLSAENYFRVAAKAGCYLAYYELGLISNQKAPTQGQKYFEIGAEAGSLNSQILYLEVILKQIQSLTAGNMLRLFKLTGLAYKLLEKIKNNPNSSPEDLADVEKQEKFLIDNINRHPNIAKAYAEKQRIETELRRLANLKGWNRLRPYIKYLSKRGNLIPHYYREHIDPSHPSTDTFNKELFKRWEKSPISKNLYEWLLQSELYLSQEFERVIYLDEEARKKFHVSLNNLGKLEYDQNNKEIVDGTYVYVLDRTENLYVASQNAEKKGFLNFHHSSFKAGGPILSGGEIIVKDGKISRIDNYSGHYHPNLKRLYAAILQLKKRNMLAEDFRIKVINIQVPTNSSINTNNLSLDELLQLIIAKKKQPEATPDLLKKQSPAYTAEQKEQMKVIEKEIENYKKAESLQQLQNFPELLNDAKIKPNLLEYLRKDIIAITAMQKTNANLGSMANLLSNLKFVDSRSQAEFASSYIVAIETGKFTEWTIYKATALLHQLLDDNYRLRSDILKIFSQTMHLPPTQVLEKLYGNPEDPKRIHEIARLLYSSCVSANAAQFYELVQKAKVSPILPMNKDFIKLANYEYLVTGILNGEPVEGSVTTFSNLNNISFDNYQELLKNISASNMIEIELEAIKNNVIRAAGIKRVTSNEIFKEYNPTQDLITRERFLIDLLHRAQPRKTTIISALKEKLKFFNDISKKLDINADKTKAIVEAFSKSISNIQLSITNDKQFNAQYRQFDEFLFANIKSLLDRSIQDPAIHNEKYKTIEAKFYDNCNSGKYQDSYHSLVNDLKSLIKDIRLNNVIDYRM